MRVLDACCGSRMFWFDRHDGRAVFMDQRRERHTLPDKSSSGGSRTLIVAPQVVADFTSMPFSDEQFSLVCFDPPHFVRNGKSGWVALKYGTLNRETWREDLRAGFKECFRVLQENGTLVFKWNESDIPVSQILALTSYRPLFGNRCGKTAQSHWLVFMKEASCQK
ncbi:MAG: class I SAM-dependent methyltransferase [Burkholderiales bacterium]